MQNVSVKFTAVETSVSEFLRWWTAAVVEMEKMQYLMMTHPDPQAFLQYL